MLNISEDEKADLFVIEPQGPLSQSDFSELNQRLEDYVDKHERVPRLLIHVQEFPGWETFSAMADHFKFVRDHQASVERIAVVSDAAVFKIIPKMTRHFVNARVRDFSNDELETAKAWAGLPDDDDEGLVLIDGLPDDVVGCEVRGEVTASDYETVLIPALTEKLERYGKLKLLYVIGGSFDTFTPGAVWDDTKFGIQHMRQFEKIAVVTDIGWIAKGTKLFAPLVSGTVHVYSQAELDQAKAWIATEH